MAHQSPPTVTSRRDFLQLSGRFLAAGASAPLLLSTVGVRPLAGGLAAVGEPAGDRRLQPREARAFEPLRRNVGIFVGNGGTMGWLVNPEGVLVVDSQFPDSAASFLVGLGDRTTRPVDVLVNTHHHGDHVGGNGVLREAAATIVAHRRARELHEVTARAAGELDPRALADETFTTEWSVRLGDETVRARHYGAAHTGGDCTVFFQEANVVHMGDLLFNRAFPFIDRPGGASIQGWVRLLEAVTAEHDARTIYVAGHANPAFGVVTYRDDLLVMRDYLSALLEHASQGIQAGRSVEEITSISSLPDFPDHQPLSPRLTLASNLQVAVEELSGGG